MGKSVAMAALDAWPRMEGGCRGDGHCSPASAAHLVNKNALQMNSFLETRGGDMSFDSKGGESCFRTRAASRTPVVRRSAKRQARLGGLPPRVTSGLRCPSLCAAELRELNHLISSVRSEGCCRANGDRANSIQESTLPYTRKTRVPRGIPIRAKAGDRRAVGPEHSVNHVPQV